MFKEVFKTMRQRKGFTLIELIVSIMVFSLFLGMTIGSFLNFVRTYADTNQKRKVYIEARQVLDSMIQELKIGRIDYDCYQLGAADQARCGEIQRISSDGVTTALVVIRKNNLERMFFRKNAAQMEVLKQKRSDVNGQFEDAVSEGYTGWLPLLGSKFLLERFYLRIWPVDDPYIYSYAEDDASQYQPKVSIFVTLKSRSRSGASEYDEVPIQTTVSSRVYGREQE